MSLEQQIPSSNCKRCVPRAFVNGETSDAYPKPPNPRSPCTSGHRTKKLTHPIEKDGQKGRQFKMFMKCALGRCAYTRHTSSELSRCAPLIGLLQSDTILLAAFRMNTHRHCAQHLRPYHLESVSLEWTIPSTALRDELVCPSR